MSQSILLTSEHAPALILFGNGDAHLPRAGWFATYELLAAEQASGPLGYAALRLTCAGERDLALMFPRGQLIGGAQVVVPPLSPELILVLRLVVVGVRLLGLKPTHQNQTFQSDPGREAPKYASQ